MSGLGLGRIFVNKHVYYIVLTEILGEEPYPGTLNIETSLSVAEIETYCLPQYIKSVISGSNIFGGFKYWLGKISTDTTGSIDVLVLRPNLSRHGSNVLEVVSSKYLRGLLGLEDGDYVYVDLRC
ncbi:MAG: DUF120 domain-containing protein [Sulfolobales archaeon]